MIILFFKSCLLLAHLTLAWDMDDKNFEIFSLSRITCSMKESELMKSMSQLTWSSDWCIFLEIWFLKVWPQIFRNQGDSPTTPKKIFFLIFSTFVFSDRHDSNKNDGRSQMMRSLLVRERKKILIFFVLSFQPSDPDLAKKILTIFLQFLFS